MNNVDGKIIASYGDWHVTDLGVECSYTPYYIDKSRLKEMDWVAQVCEKTWVVKGDFNAAYDHAVSIFCP
ncbi:hypothetical protein ACU5EH_00770 [Aliivibrio salmonicida]|uniref:hypothetical protein n=1 Tax=Aliivibrio salmonicida TaxID=40269 RepID=UPI00406C917F